MNILIEKDERLLNSIIGHLEHFEDAHWYKISANTPYINGLTTKLWKEAGNFKTEFAITDLLNQTQLGAVMLSKQLNLLLTGSLYSITIQNEALEHFTANAALGYGYTSFSGIIKGFTTNLLEADTPAKYLSVISCKDEHSNSTNFLGAYFLPASDLKIGRITYGSRLLHLVIQGHSIDCYLYGKENTQTKYLFIEARTPVTHKQFQGIVNEFLLTLNFLTGHAPGNEIYVLNNTDESSERWDEHRIVSYDCLNEKLTSSGFAVIPQIGDHIVEHNVLQRNKGTAFLATMVEQCILSAAFRRTLLLMVQANVQPDYIKVIQFAVALESVAKIYYEANEEKLNPISDKGVAKDLRLALKAELEKFNNRITDDAKGRLHNYLDRINSPTNADMLTKPFVQLGITLADLDLDAIKKRNDFLHGRLPADAGTHELSAIALRLQFCVNALIMKSLGYEGAVWYHATLYQHHHHQHIDSPAFRLL